MSKPNPERHMQALGRLISDRDFEMKENHACVLLDLGYIQEDRWSEKVFGAICDFSCYIVTPKGKEAFKKWNES